MNVIVAVLSRHRHPRLRYILKVISMDLGVRFQLFTDLSQWIAADAAGKLAYGYPELAADAVSIPAHPLLSGGHPEGEDLTVSWKNGTPYFLQNDPLACAFYSLSRYEEYQHYPPDQHGRFSASYSHARQNDYLKLPVVRLWEQRLYQTLREAYPALPALKAPPLVFKPTYDIDILWAYQYRGWKGVASGLRDLLSGNFKRAVARFFQPKNRDPYDIIEALLALHPENKARLFWLLADNQAREDINPYPVPEAQYLKMRALVTSADMGIHPGYNSISAPNKAEDEIHRYQEIFGVSPRHSRQHFLRFSLPDSYRKLRSLGLTHEHSMGYADAVGWRAGTNLPFFWYDLEKEETTGLLIHSFVAMDATLKNYLNLSSEAAIKEVLDLADKCREVGGDFPLLWHNSSCAPAHGWAGWREAYAIIVRSLTT